MTTSIRFTKLASIFPRGHFVQWVVEDAKESGAYAFDLFRAGGPDGPWDLLATGLVDAYSYFDRFDQPVGTTPDTFLRPNQLRLFRNFYYRVQVTTPSGKQYTAVEEVGTILGQKGESLVARKMAQYHRRAVRNFEVGLNRFVGTRVALLKRRVWGTRCTACTDLQSKEVVRPNCTSCWGTAFVGGYWAPTASVARRGAQNSTTQTTPQQKADGNQVQVWLPELPALEADDVVVFLEDQKRFRIAAQVQTEIRLTAVHQVFTCEEIDRSNILYRLKVQTDQLAPLY